MFSQLRRADEYFKHFEYAKAISLYEKSLKKIDAKDTVHLIRLGVSYMRTNDYVKAEKIFEELIKIEGINPNCHLYYGEVLHVNLKIEKAKEQFKIYTNLMPHDERGKELYNTTELLRKNDTLAWVKAWNFEPVNTPYSEFSPIFYKNGLVFTSDRKSGWLDDDVCGWTNRPYLSLFYCEIKADSIDTIAKSPVPFDKRINTQSHNGIGSFNKEQSHFFFTRVDNKSSRDTNYVNQSKIYEADLVNNKWKNIKGFKYNSNNYTLEHPNLSPSGNKLFFVSDMPGGFGGKDIYYCIKEGDGWSEPKNLGREVNSEGDEMFPHAKTDNVLYFSSNGHQGYGGLDIYVSSYKDAKWTSVVNMKLPLNSNYDDFGIAFYDKESGYFSSNRINGFGNDDIYFFSFNRKELIVTIERQKENTPIFGASAYVMDQPNSVVDSAKTNKAGKITFDGLTPDPYMSLMLDVPDASFKGWVDPTKVKKDMKILITNKNKIIDSVTVDSMGNFAYTHKYVNLKSSIKFKKGANIVIRRKDGSVISSYKATNSKSFVIPHIENEKSYIVDILPLKDSVLKGHLIMKGRISYEVDSAWSISGTQMIFRIGNKTFDNIYTDSLGRFEFDYLMNEPVALADINEKDTDLNLKVNINGQLVIETKNVDYSVMRVVLKTSDGVFVNYAGLDKNGGFLFKNIPFDKNYLMEIEEPDDNLGFNHKISGTFTRVDEKEFKKEVSIDLIKENVELASGFTDSNGKFNLDYLPKDRNNGESNAPDTGLRIMRGTIANKDTNGNLSDSLMVILKTNQGKVIDKVKLSKNGSFEIKNIPNDSAYVLDINANDDKLKFKATIKGKILNAKSLKPEKGIMMSLDEDDTGLKFSKTNAKGEFSFDIVPKVIEPSVKLDSLVIYFEYNKYSISNEETIALEALYKQLNKTKGILEINTYADSRGTDAYNTILSANRAKTIKNYFVGKGVSSSKIKTKHFGETNILNKCKDGIDCDDNEHRVNRRCVIYVKTFSK